MKPYMQQVSVRNKAIMNGLGVISFAYVGWMLGIRPLPKIIPQRLHTPLLYVGIIMAVGACVFAYQAWRYWHEKGDWEIYLDAHLLRYSVPPVAKGDGFTIGLEEIAYALKRLGGVDFSDEYAIVTVKGRVYELDDTIIHCDKLFHVLQKRGVEIKKLQGKWDV